ncbi:MAG: hypothetical protein ACXAEU_06745 [Candidatus Hodarchaeales archaeon]|jgi:hypothetical protein
MENILEYLKGSRGIIKIREQLEKANKNWNVEINILKTIQKEKILKNDLENESLDALFHGFQLLRMLRNRASHPNSKFLEEQSEFMLSLLVYLQEELRTFLGEKEDE